MRQKRAKKSLIIKKPLIFSYRTIKLGKAFSVLSGKSEGVETPFRRQPTRLLFLVRLFETSNRRALV